MTDKEKICKTCHHSKKGKRCDERHEDCKLLKGHCSSTDKWGTCPTAEPCRFCSLLVLDENDTNMNNDYAAIRDTLKSLDKKTLCYLISDMMLFDKIDITDINQIYTERLKEKIAEKDRIIKEADNCIFNSLAYDHMKKPCRRNVVIEKVRWRYKYADTNKEALCEMFNYNPEEDKKL